MPQCAWESQRTTWGSQFSLSIVSLRMELRMSLLAASSVTHWTISLISFFFLRCVRVLHVGVDECLYVYICVSACSHVSVESYGWCHVSSGSLSMLYDTASLAELSSLFLLVQIPSLLKGAPSQSLVPRDFRQAVSATCGLWWSKTPSSCLRW